MAQAGRSCAFPGSVACVQRQAAGLRTPARWARITLKGEHRGPKHGNETSTRMFEVRYGSHTGLSSDMAPSPFLLRRLSYRRDLPPERADNPRSELAWM